MLAQAPSEDSPEVQIDFTTAKASIDRKSWQSGTLLHLPKLAMSFSKWQGARVLRPPVPHNAMKMVRAASSNVRMFEHQIG